MAYMLLMYSTVVTAWNDTKICCKQSKKISSVNRVLECNQPVPYVCVLVDMVRETMYLYTIQKLGGDFSLSFIVKGNMWQKPSHRN